MKKCCCTLLIVLTVVFCSCKKNKCEGADQLSYQISGPSAVNAGDTATLIATGFAGATYVWQGPAWFTASERTIHIPIDNANYAGTYSVHYTSDDNCVDRTESITITVNAVTAPCNPVASHISFAGYNQSMGASYSNNEISCNSMNADLLIHFVAPPVTGIYRCVNMGTMDFDMQPNQVIMTLTSFNYYGAAAGSLLYIKVESGNVTASFCNTTFGPWTATASVSATM